MDTTASYSAACKIAKLRVGCTVAGCAPGVPRIDISSRFQSTTDCPEPGAKATDAGGPATPRPAAATKAATFPFLRILMTPREMDSVGATGQQSPKPRRRRATY